MGLLVTGILLTYDCEKFVAQALRAALEQQCEPMQLIVSDDASTDATFAILRREIASYRGEHKVELRQRDVNSGSKSAHLNDVLRFASGEIITFFDGDDVSKPLRVRKVVEKFDDPVIHAVYSAYSLIDESGRHIGRGDVPFPRGALSSKEWFAPVGAYASGGALAIRRAVYASFGDIDPILHEDVVLPFRASLLGEVAYIEEELVRARRHQSLTQNYRDFANLDSYRVRHRFGVDQAHLKCNSRFADIAKAEQLFPERIDEFRDLRDIVRRSVIDAEASLGLVSGSLGARISALLRLVRSPNYRDKLTRDVFLALTPKNYLRYKRFKLRGLR